MTRESVNISRLRRRWRLLTIMQAINIGLFVAVGVIVVLLQPDKAQSTQIMLVCGPPFALTALYIVFFRCPRCGKLFHGRPWEFTRWPYSSTCVQCGLPRGCMNAVGIESPPPKEYMPPLVF